ncbi:hypothetical protein DTO271D3_7074 [Paecilomyces variotii]|nr:hypothetical protein DTO271D3_7074 [Paecilomyces variotii]
MESLSLLLQSPHKWTSQQFQLLRLVQHSDTPAANLIDPEYLPADQDEEFETLHAEFIEPTEDDLANFSSTRSIYRRNSFHSVFARLNEAMRSHSSWSETSKQAILFLCEILLSHIEAAKNLPRRISTKSKFRFEILSSSVRGALSCDGTLISEAASPQLVGIFSVKKENDTSYLARLVSQVLLQGVLAYEDNMAVMDNHTAFVLRMERTVLKLTMARVSPTYMEELTHGKPLSGTFEVFHSEPYDLCKREGRGEALRLIIGLYRYINAKGRT